MGVEYEGKMEENVKASEAEMASLRGKAEKWVKECEKTLSDRLSQFSLLSLLENVGNPTAPQGHLDLNLAVWSMCQFNFGGIVCLATVASSV